MITLILVALGLTAVTVIIHGFGSATASRRADQAWAACKDHPARLGSELIMARLVGVLLLLHLFEAVVWALFFMLVESLPDFETSVYFSLATYTTVGYGDVVLPDRWRLLGPIESAVGVLMLGWSTGVLVAMIGTMHRHSLPPAAGSK